MFNEKGPDSVETLGKIEYAVWTSGRNPYLSTNVYFEMEFLFLEREGHGAARMRIGRSVGVLLQTALSWPPCCVYCMMQCEKELSMPIDQN